MEQKYQLPSVTGDREPATRLHVEPYSDPACDRLGFQPNHPYVEHCWLPVIGPSSTWLLRRLAGTLALHPGGYDVELGDLGHDLGLGSRAGRNAPLRRSLDRLVLFGLARWSGPGSYQVRRSVPPLSARELRRLGPGPLGVHHGTLRTRDADRNPLLQAALRYAALGWPVLPLRPAAKLPDGTLVPHGLNDATCDARRIASWWRSSPAANVGLRTGITVDVIDIDGPDARHALEERCPELFSAGLAVATGRGWHLYFAATGLPSRAGLLPGVDVRGAGGYVVAPPSAHPDGSRYRFVDLRRGSEPDEGPAALTAVPPSFVDLCRPAHRPATAHEPLALSVGITSYARKALDDECAQVAVTTEGQRNERLNRAAFAMGTLVGAEALDARLAAGRLLEAAGRAGLAEREAMRTIASGLKAGTSHPRRLAVTDGLARPVVTVARRADPARAPSKGRSR